MRPGSDRLDNSAYEVLMPRIPTQTMGPLHSSAHWLPTSLAPQRVTFSLPFVQIEMPLHTPSLWQASNTMTVSHRLNSADSQQNRFIGLQQIPELEPPWFVPGVTNYEYTNDTESSQEQTTSHALSQTSAEIESQNLLIDEILPMTYQQSSEITRETGTGETVSSYTNSGDLSLSVTSLRVFFGSSIQKPNFVARQVANRVIRYARYNKIADVDMMQCLDCGLIPILPVTGQCGHTRCTECIKNNGACTCGVVEPASLHVNTLIQDLITKMSSHRQKGRDTTMSWNVIKKQALIPSTTAIKPERVNWLPVRHRRYARSRFSYRASVSRSFDGGSVVTITMSMQTRFKYARQLIFLGRHHEAASHLAHVAASTDPMAKQAHALLAQTIMTLTQSKDSRRVVRELNRAVKQHSATAWLQASDLECILCCNTFTEPVTTPCGHTYCRTCIEKALDYRKTCALCLRSLDNFNLAMTHNTHFVIAALKSINAFNPPRSPEPDVIPIFVCTVAYPSIPCPLFIFDPRYWMMVRRVLESGSRRFGMVAYERDRSYSDYGTILKVCDCVHLEDGRSILSTVGISRFRVLERDVRDGCEVARIQPLTDITPTDSLMIWDLRLIASQICCKALLWLNTLNKSSYSEIEAAFGRMPQIDSQMPWWESQDGPAWLWWLIAILPLRSEIKVLILSTQSLLKRMTAVARTLEAIDQITTTTSAELQLRRALNSAEEWLQRTS